MPEKPMYSVVIPVYNSSDSLVLLASEITTIFRQKIKQPFEILFIDDASTNSSTSVSLTEISKSLPENCIVIFLETNVGQHKATLCGFKYATGDYLITMDDDLQHKPEWIINLLEHKNHDIVVARFTEKKVSVGKKILGSIKTKIDQYFFNYPPNIQLTSFRLIKKNVARCMLNKVIYTSYIPSLMISCTKDIATIELQHNIRQHGISNYSVKKVLRFALSIFGNIVKNKTEKAEQWKIKEVLNVNE